MSKIDPTLLSFDAVLLAGGYSRRMGTDKACLRLATGELLWERQRRVLHEAGAETIWVSIRRDQDWAPADVARVFDQEVGGGPIDGILAAWEQSQASHLMVLAVDLPRLPAEWFLRLKAACAHGKGVVGQHADGAYEPLAGIFPKTWQENGWAAQRSGERSLQHVLRRAEAAGELISLPISNREWFLNANEPSDFAGF